jgi:hypothetical protein
MSNYKRKEVMDYLIRKPVTTQDIELARTRIQPPVTPAPMQVTSGEGLGTVQEFNEGGRVEFAEGDIVKASGLSELLKEYDVEISPKNIGRFSKNYEIKKDPDRPSASGFYVEPSEKQLEKISSQYKKNVLKAPGSTEAGRKAFEKRETRARELLTQGYNQTEADNILKKEFNMGMKTTLTKVANDLKEEGIKVVSGRESEIKTPTSKFLKKRRELQKATSDPYKEKLITEAKREAGFGSYDLAHRLSMQQNKILGTELISSNLGLDTKKINREIIKPIENKLEKIYKKQVSVANKIKREGASSELRKELESLNKQVSEVVATTDGRLQGIHIDEYNLKPKTIGIDYAKSFGAGVIPDKPISQLTKEEIQLAIKQIPGQLEAIKKEPSLAARMSNQLGFGPSGMIDVGEEVIKDVKGIYGKYAPQIAKGALTGLQVLGTPLASSIFYGTDVGMELKQAADEGNLTAKKALDAFVGQGEKGLYFLLPELAKDVVTSPIANKIFQLGSLGRFATPVGLGLSAAGVAKDFYDQYKEFQALPPEEKEKRIKESTYTPTEQDFQIMQEAESRASAATGGRIGYADGSDDPESDLYIPPLNNTKRLGPEDRISKYKSYSELELLGNIDAKKPNYEILEDYIYRNMPTYEPKDVVPKGSRPVMPNEYDRGPSDGILNLAVGGRVGFKDGPEDPNKLIPIDPLLQDQSPTDPGRRDVLKLGIAGAGLLGLGKLGLLKLGSVAKPSIIAEVTKGTTAPSWMEGLMTKILKEGTEIKMPKESSIIKKEVQFKNPETGDVQTATLTIDPRSDRMSIEYNSSTNVADQPVVLELYRERKAVQNPDGKSFHLAPDKTKGYRFTTTESGPRVVDWDGNIEFDAEDTYYKIIDLKSDISGLKSYATEGKGINKKVAQEKRAATADIEKNPEEYVPDNYPDYKYYPND